MVIEDLVARQHTYFRQGKTLGYEQRMHALRALKKMVVANTQTFEQALAADLGKSPYESYMTETGMVLHEISHAMKHLKRWMRVRRVRPSLAQMPARCRIMTEPLGVVLIMAPWNYPVQLSLSPLVAALAAGNCAVIKPSAYAPHVSQALADSVSACFDPSLVAVVQGGRAENIGLLQQRYDHIFFTGSTTVGKVVMEAASKHLCPVTLELGGKSPVIVDPSADVAQAAKRIVFGKIINAGQTCIAPDYVMVHRSLHDALVKELSCEIARALGVDPLANGDYPKIVNQHRFEHLVELMNDSTILHGGKSSGLKIEPTVVSCTADHPLMQEEIFGPILPVLPYDDPQEVFSFIGDRPKPLALYLFSTDTAFQKEVLSRLSFGGGCVNDTIMHIGSPWMPFGGVGYSGMGAYHGKTGFDTLSHHKSIIYKGAWFDLPMRYHPYSEQAYRMVKRMLR